LRTWQELWQGADAGRHTYDVLPNVKERLRNYNLAPDHITTQFLSGHGDFGAKLYVFRRRDSPDCECGEAEQDAVHILKFCPIYATLRQEAIARGLSLEPAQLLRPKTLKIFRWLCHSIATSRGTHGALPPSQSPRV